MELNAHLDFLQEQSKSAQYVTSVCTGSLILAAAGLLQGYKATCHWAVRDQLAMLGVEVIPKRVVIGREEPLNMAMNSDGGAKLSALNCVTSPRHQFFGVEVSKPL